MEKFDPKTLKDLCIPPPSSHKGQNGKVMIIAGSQLFHSASFWALETASKIADMVFFSSVPVNNEIVKEQKRKFQAGIIVPRDKVEDYVAESDCILIGTGLPRPDGWEEGDNDTRELTEGLFAKFPLKRWVIDGGSIQTIEPPLLPKGSILTPHQREFETLFGVQANKENASQISRQLEITILLKGEVDIIANPVKTVLIPGGNAGMTKGGTGDVLAALVASLYAKNDAFLSASCASYINKKAGDALFKEVGHYFSASDLVKRIPEVMNELIPQKVKAS